MDRRQPRELGEQEVNIPSIQELEAEIAELKAADYNAMTPEQRRRNNDLLVNRQQVLQALKGAEERAVRRAAWGMA